MKTISLVLAIFIVIQINSCTIKDKSTAENGTNVMAYYYPHRADFHMIACGGWGGY